MCGGKGGTNYKGQYMPVLRDVVHSDAVLLVDVSVSSM